MPHARESPERLSMFSDGVFAVLITVLVLELRPPELPTFRALFLLWPTWLSYAVSYLFIAIVWVNHHHLLRYATEAIPRLMWFNFAHLFSVSLIPLFYCLDGRKQVGAAACCLLCCGLLLRECNLHGFDLGAFRALPRQRSLAEETQGHALPVDCDFKCFGIAAVAAFEYPLVGLGMCIFCLIVYLKPEDIVP